MSSNGYSQPAVPPHRSAPGIWGGSALYGPFPFPEVRPRQRYWLHALLFLLTLLSTTVVGAGMAADFAQNRPVDFDANLYGYVRMWHEPSFLLAGLPFALSLLGILMAHEMGHFLAARYYHVNVTLPFFLPAPTLIGTLGAFIRIRSAVPTKRVMFDIGIAGPLAGFVALLAPLASGVSLSKVIPGIANRGDLIFGTPLILRLVEWVQFPGVSPADLYLHPVARAAWAGLLATALNLLPIGQLDGGHILYALVGERIKVLSYAFIAALIPLGIFFSYSWLVWAALLFFIARRHPFIPDDRPLDPVRRRLAWVALAILILSFTPAPVRT
ncbi:MAG TPA: site-2 protease family protein [Bryobacteraceae bacterium]|nr:site-2 protease family protein [Bryobacteraceae bacterium]